MWSNVITNNSYSNYIENLTSAELRLFHGPWFIKSKYQSLPHNLTIYSLVQWWINHPEKIEDVLCRTSPMRKDGVIAWSMLGDNEGFYSIGEFAVGYNNILNTMNFRSNFKYKKNFPPGFDAFKNPDFCEIACRSNNIFNNFKTIGPKGMDHLYRWSLL
ncbi:hypothetical protein KQX54_012946 [Cotesia glomerata]|uniref:Uncharacterized protein n=1 Tax=Cotesia glomerata TaxID=32391 RepID=A0AAV7IKH8_COTGL|nr:hypothetical protein KQX54_012946 [Cotesia glomerata]